MLPFLDSATRFASCSMAIKGKVSVCAQIRIWALQMPGRHEIYTCKCQLQCDLYADTECTCSCNGSSFWV